jgi:hypothetical protein
MKVHAGAKIGTISEHGFGALDEATLGVIDKGMTLDDASLEAGVSQGALEDWMKFSTAIGQSSAILRLEGVLRLQESLVEGLEALYDDAKYTVSKDDGAAVANCIKLENARRAFAIALIEMKYLQQYLKAVYAVEKSLY